MLGTPPTSRQLHPLQLPFSTGPIRGRVFSAIAGSAAHRSARLLIALIAFGVFVLGAVPAAVEAAADDYAANTSTTGTVVVGGSQTGEIESHGDVDWIRVTLVGGTRYVIDYDGSANGQGTLSDPYFRGVYDSNGNLISGTTDSNGGLGFNSRIDFTPGSSGTYFLGLGNGAPSLTGTYRVSVTEFDDYVVEVIIPGDDYEDDITTTGSVSVGGSVVGNFQKASGLSDDDWIRPTVESISDYFDHDWFRVNFDAGKTYRVHIKGSWTDHGTLRDTRIAGIYDSNGNLIAGTVDDNSGIDKEARTIFTAPTTGTHYISVTGGEFPFPAQSSGTYTVKVVEIGGDDYVANTSTTGSVTVDGSTTGTIERPGDLDWFAVTLEAYATYRFDLEGIGEDWPLLEGKFIWGIYDSNGNLFAGTYTPEWRDDEVRAVFAPEQGGTYYVAVGAGETFFGTGKYRLSATKFIPEVSDGLDTQGLVGVGFSVEGDKEEANDRDWFRVTLEAGTTYQIDLEGSPTNQGTLRDPYLHGVYDAEGDPIWYTSDADSGVSVNSRVTFTPDTDGTYYVAAGALFGLTGTYRLSVRERSELSVADAEASESNDATLDFVVTLDPAATAAGTVDYATADGTATAGADYTATSGTLTFRTGDTEKTISVPIIDDSVEDDGETLTLTLSNASGATLADSVATGTIRNTEVTEPDPLTASFPASVYASKSHSGTDDRPQVVAAFSEAVAAFTKDTPSVSVTNASVASVQAHTEDGLENAYIFFLTPNGDGDVTFTFEADSACASGGVCTSAGIPLTDVPTALTIPGPEETTQTSQLSVADAAASEEDDSTIDFVVTLSPASDETVSVNYAASDGTATAGDDYTAKNGSLTFNAGETSKTIQVSIIDDTVDDDNETLTVTLSNASGAEISDGQATGAITDGDTETSPLTAAFQDLPDSHDGSATFTFRVLFSEDVGISYANMRDDAFSLSDGDVTGARRVDGRNDLWEITVEPDGDDGVAVTLTGNRACTTAGAICTREDSPRQLTNSPTATVTGPAEEPSTNTSAAGAPTISGTPQVEQTLTADTSSITDADGLTNVSYSYQWIAGGSDIAGATSSTYTLTSSEQGQTVQVRVTFTDDADNEETLTSAATVAVAAAPNRDATGAPTISGTPQVEQTLTADTSSITDADGLTNVSYSYQWIAGGSDIAGATGSTYKITASEQGQTIQVRVTFTDDADNDESRTSAATVAVAAAPNRDATGAPTIGGTPQVGETLTADTSPIDDADGLTNVSYRYQWMAGGSDIAGATGSSYTLTSSEEGQTIQVRVTFTDDADNDESLTSVATAEVTAAPVPLTVSVTVAAPTTHDGSSEFTFEIEFSEEFGLSYVTLRDFAFTETGGEVRKAQRMDKPSNIRWLITVEPNGNGDVTIVLPVTTDCNADGAICTGDGRKLSNSLSFTVSGPGQ